MIGRDVERIEVVRVGFDLRTEHDRETVPREVARDVDGDAADRMDRAEVRRRPGEGDVDRILERPFERRALEPRLRGGELGLHRLDRGVDDLARVRTFGRRQCADPAPHGGHLAAAAQKGDARVVERARVGRAGQRVVETRRQRREDRFE